MAAAEPKPLCKFGENCYRKNPQHLKQFRHPKRKQEEVLSLLTGYFFIVFSLFSNFLLLFGGEYVFARSAFFAQALELVR